MTANQQTCLKIEAAISSLAGCESDPVLGREIMSLQRLQQQARQGQVDMGSLGTVVMNLSADARGRGAVSLLAEVYEDMVVQRRSSRK